MASGDHVGTVAELMSRPAVTALPSETIATASTRMEEARVGSVVVVEGDRPIGILTERDLIRFAASGADSSKTMVSEWMTRSPYTVKPTEEIRTAFGSLAEHGYRHIPVVEESGAIAGIVSLRDLMKVAQIEPMVHPSQMEVPPGLDGVIVAETTVGDVRGLEGFYHYRQYNAVELAKTRPLEDAWKLLFDGELPKTLAEREAFRDEIRPLREIPASVKPLLPAIAQAGDEAVSLDALRTAVSLVAQASAFKSWIDIPISELRSNVMQICAVVPTLIGALYRLRHGLEPKDPHPDLGYGANYLYMLFDEELDPDLARAVEQYQTTTIDHGFNASTFTSRVITSTGADAGAAIVGGIGALSGPLHGGAPSRALELLDTIGTEENIRPYITNAVEQGERIMGFGHRVYKTDDPRSLFLRSVAERIHADKLEFATKVEHTIVETLKELKPGRNLYANVEFYAGVVMDHCGLPRDLFTPTFASSRVIGWSANILEQAGANRIIRPIARYVGPPPPQPLPTLE